MAKPNSVGLQSQIQALTPEIGEDIDRELSGRPGGVQSALGAGLGGAMTGVLVKIVLARVLPLLKDGALKLLDQKVAQIQAAHPEFDLSFIHGLVASLFDAIGGDAGVGAAGPAVGTMGPGL